MAEPQLPTEEELAEALRPAPLTTRRLTRPWQAVFAGALLLVIGVRAAGAWAGHSGERFDLVMDLSLVTFVSIGLVWAPMWTMRNVRLIWRRLDLAARQACARQILLQGIIGAPVVWAAVAWATRDVHGGRLLAGSAVGSVLISLGAAGSLWLRARR